MIIGNLTRDPELRTTQSGVSVCNFTIAVNRRQTAQAGQPEADFFRVNAWRALGENCHRWLVKGKKVAVVGRVSADAYMGNDGQAHAQMNVDADEVEFLSPATPEAPAQPRQPYQQAAQQTSIPNPGGGFVQVPDEPLPF